MALLGERKLVLLIMRFLAKLGMPLSSKLLPTLLPTACRLPTANLGQMPIADGIRKTRQNGMYSPLLNCSYSFSITISFSTLYSASQALQLATC